MDLTDVYKNIEAIDTDNETKSQLKEHVFLYSQAGLASKEGRYKDSISILEMLLERVPEDLNAKKMLAAVYESAGYPVKSIRLWEEICEAEPYVGEYSLALALAYRNQDWMQKALKQLKTTVELTPDNRIAWEYLVECSYETEDTHETKMNCFGAMYLLKEYGIESIRLNAFAFSLTILEDNDRADKYLTTIIDIMRSGEKQQTSRYEEVIHMVLWEIDMADCYEFLPRVSEMADCLFDISEDLAESIKNVETNAEIVVIREDFPKVIYSIIEELNEGCDCDECKRDLVAMECSILADHDGYRPELMRLSEEHPKLYALHSRFFDEAVTGIDWNKQLNTRYRILSEYDVEPILTRADGSEINPVIETYHREGRKIGRNEKCPCGSGKKYKKCCGA